MDSNEKTSPWERGEVKGQYCLSARVRQVVEVQVVKPGGAEGGVLTVEYWSPEGELLAVWDETMCRVGPEDGALHDYCQRFRPGGG